MCLNDMFAVDIIRRWRQLIGYIKESFVRNFSLCILNVLKQRFSYVSYLPLGSFIIGIVNPIFVKCICDTYKSKQRAKVNVAVHPIAEMPNAMIASKISLPFGCKSAIIDLIITNLRSTINKVVDFLYLGKGE